MVSISSTRSPLLSHSRSFPVARSRRRFATALQHLPSPSPYLPLYPDPSPSSIATSSAWTLDHPLWTLPTPSRERNNIVAALIFASDEDLVSALISNTPSSRTSNHQEEEWAASIDPGLAFLALRTRSTYDLFLHSLFGSHLTVVYAKLQRSDTHQLLVSDLLLRHPDPRILRELLELDSKAIKGRLRPSLIISIYSTIYPSLPHLPPLSKTTCKLLLKTIINEKVDKINVLSALWEQSRQSLVENGYAEDIWSLLSLCLHISSLSPRIASDWIVSLVADRVIPSAFVEEINPSDPLMIQCTILQFALLHRFAIRSQSLSEALLGTMENQGFSIYGWNILLESIRTALASKDIDQSAWAAEILKRMCHRVDWSFVPCATVESVIGSIPPEQRMEWYASLPSGTYDPPTASFLLHLAIDLPPTGELWNKLVYDLTRLPPEETQHVQAEFLRHLIKTQSITLLDKVFSRWGSLQLSLSDISEIVETALEKDQARVALRILKEWDGDRPLLESRHRLSLALLFLKLGEKSLARRQLAGVNIRESGIVEQIAEVLTGLPADHKTMFVQMGLAQ